MEWWAVRELNPPTPKGPLLQSGATHHLCRRPLGQALLSDDREDRPEEYRDELELGLIGNLLRLVLERTMPRRPPPRIGQVA